MNQESIPFSELVTDMTVLYDAEEGYYNGNSAIYFRIDSGTYVGVEDPDDGYRCCLNGIYKIDNYKFTNRIESRVVAITATTEFYHQDKLTMMEFFSDNKLIVLGTDYSDSYYPWAIMELNLQ